MNNRFFIHQITVFHFINDKNVSKMDVMSSNELMDDSEDEPLIRRYFFNKVYFRHNKKINLIDKGIEKGSTGSITIPTSEELDIFKDDYIIEGIIEDKFDERTLIKKYQLYKVVSVDDNRKGNLKHYKIGVSE